MGDDMLEEAQAMRKTRAEPVDVDAELEDIEGEFQGMHEDRVAGLGAGAPSSHESLPPTEVNMLCEQLDATIESLSNGQLPQGERQTYTEGLKVLPPPVFAKLRTIEQLIASAKLPEMESYAFDAEQLASSPEGLREAIGIVHSLGRDPAVKKALAAPQRGKNASGKRGSTGDGSGGGRRGGRDNVGDAGPADGADD
jgi:hypothetical protein